MKHFPHNFFYNFYSSLIKQIKTDKKAFWVFFILRLFVIFVIVRCVIENRWESVFVGVLALILFMIPPFVEKQFKVHLPTTLEIIAFIFIFCAEILGEIEGYYVLYPFWDAALHTINGFMFAAFGFCLVDLLNQSHKFRFQLSPLFVAIMAFCFSMTIGVCWEFLEFIMDSLFHLDMQKDAFVTTIGTVSLDPNHGNAVQTITGIVSTTIETANGDIIVIEGGYLDIGIVDTMKDLMVNFIGAAIFSVFGYLYVKQRGKGKIASQFIPVFIGNNDDVTMIDSDFKLDDTIDQITFDDVDAISDTHTKIGNNRLNDFDFNFNFDDDEDDNKDDDDKTPSSDFGNVDNSEDKNDGD